VDLDSKPRSRRAKRAHKERRNKECPLRRAKESEKFKASFFPKLSR
jgi:hypothetical protein